MERGPGNEQDYRTDRTIARPASAHRSAAATLSSSRETRLCRGQYSSAQQRRSLMRLAELFPQADIPAGWVEREISGNSRTVTKDMVFFAVPGTRQDGLSHVPQAIERGAVAIIAEADPRAPIGGAAFIKTDNVRGSLAHAAARIYSRQPETIVAVTGTSGKTSVADFTRQIWMALGKEAASIGTLGVVTAQGPESGSLTTPDPVTLHKTLDELARGGVTHLAL